MIDDGSQDDTEEKLRPNALSNVHKTTVMIGLAAFETVRGTEAIIGRIQDHSSLDFLQPGLLSLLAENASATMITSEHSLRFKCVKYGKS